MTFTHLSIVRFLCVACIRKSYKVMFTFSVRHVMIPAIQVVRLHQVSLSGLAVRASQDHPANIQQSITVVDLVADGGKGDRSPLQIFCVFALSKLTLPKLSQ